MDTAATLRTLELLADGKDPATGLSLPDASPYNQPAVVRSLFTAIRALESTARPVADSSAAVVVDASSTQNAATLGERPRNATASASSRTLPANAGKPWTEGEDNTLCAAFDQGVAIKELAVQHGRSTTALNARLFKLGKIADPGIPLRHPVQTASKPGKRAEGRAAKAIGSTQATP